MNLIFADEELRQLCNTRSLLRARFGAAAAVVERRLLILGDAKVLGEIPVRPPDRRRREPLLGPTVASVCAKAAGRIYFSAFGITGNDDGEWEEVKEIEIFAIGRANT